MCIKQLRINKMSLYKNSINIYLYLFLIFKSPTIPDSAAEFVDVCY